MAIKTIEICGLQSHKNLLVVELPETGIVRFMGENNEGKSVITKVTAAIIKQKLNRKTMRQSLITRGLQYGEIKFTKYNGDSLKAHIALESAHTYLELTKDGIVTRRYILDKGLDFLVKEFGFHYDENRDFSLNVYETYDPLFFITTPSVTNYDILQNAITDSGVTRAIENIQEVRKQIRDAKEQSIRNIGQIQSAIATLSFCDDIEAEKLKARDLMILQADLKCLRVLPDIPDIPEQINLSDIFLLDKMDVIYESLDSINVLETDLLNDIEILLNIKRIPNVSEHIDKINEGEQALLNNTCPTCKRNFAEHISHA